MKPGTQSWRALRKVLLFVFLFVALKVLIQPAAAQQGSLQDIQSCSPNRMSSYLALKKNFTSSHPNFKRARALYFRCSILDLYKNQGIKHSKITIDGEKIRVDYPDTQNYNKAFSAHTKNSQYTQHDIIYGADFLAFVPKQEDTGNASNQNPLDKKSEKKSASRSNTQSFIEMRKEAFDYLFGYNGKPKDIETALRKYREAVALGDSESMVWVGRYTKDPEEQFRMFHTAAEKLNWRAMLELSKLYVSGSSVVKPNIAKAEHWLEEARGMKALFSDKEINKVANVINFEKLASEIESCSKQAIDDVLLIAPQNKRHPKYKDVKLDHLACEIKSLSRVNNIFPASQLIYEGNLIIRFHSKGERDTALAVYSKTAKSNGFVSYHNEKSITYALGTSKEGRQLSELNMKQAAQRAKASNSGGTKLTNRKGSTTSQPNQSNQPYTKTTPKTQHQLLADIKKGNATASLTVAENYFYGRDGYEKSLRRAKYWLDRAKATASSGQAKRQIQSTENRFNRELNVIRARNQKHYEEVILPQRKEQEAQDRLERAQQAELAKAEQQYKDELERIRRQQRAREAEESAESEAQMWRDVVSGIQRHGESIRNDMQRNHNNTVKAYQQDQRSQKRRENDAKAEFEKKRQAILEKAKRDRERLLAQQQAARKQKQASSQKWDCKNNWRADKCGDRITEHTINWNGRAYTDGRNTGTGQAGSSNPLITSETRYAGQTVQSSSQSTSAVGKTGKASSTRPKSTAEAYAICKIGACGQWMCAGPLQATSVCGAGSATVEEELGDACGAKSRGKSRVGFKLSPGSSKDWVKYSCGFICGDVNWIDGGFMSLPGYKSRLENRGFTLPNGCY